VTASAKGEERCRQQAYPADAQQFSPSPSAL